MRHDRCARAALAAALLTLVLAGCSQPPTQAERLARLAPVPTNDIPKDPALDKIALTDGKAIYEAQCASCHGPDAKGMPSKHAPDLTDSDWLFDGDDYDSGGLIHFPSDIEKTTLYGIRADNEQTRKDADMPALGPQHMNILTDQNIDDVTQYVLMLGGQPYDKAAAERATAIWDDKGSCYDCHGYDGTGNGAIGATNLTKPRLYLYGSDAASIRDSIANGRHGVMPAFEGKLKPEEIKAVSVYLFSLVPPQKPLP